MLTVTEIVRPDDDECMVTHIIARCVNPDCEVCGWHQIIPLRDHRPRTMAENVALLMAVTGARRG